MKISIKNEKLLSECNHARARDCWKILRDKPRKEINLEFNLYSLATPSRHGRKLVPNHIAKGTVTNSDYKIDITFDDDASGWKEILGIGENSLNSMPVGPMKRVPELAMILGYIENIIDDACSNNNDLYVEKAASLIE